MSILIKGAKLPKKCCDCILLPAEINWEDQWECPITEKIVHKYVEERKGKPPDCPLIEIPLYMDRILKELPSADVVEVRHGYWDNDMECSICGCLAPVSHVTGEEYAYEYCPNCGAKMDRKEQDHE